MWRVEDHGRHDCGRPVSDLGNDFGIRDAADCEPSYDRCVDLGANQGWLGGRGQYDRLQRLSRRIAAPFRGEGTTTTTSVVDFLSPV